jgi:hypothetical protein
LLETVGQRNALLSSIERTRGSAVVAYMLHDNAMIADDALPQLYDKLESLGRRERIDLLLFARSGVVEVAWRMLNMLREHCDTLGVIVGTRVAGAASVIALGADEIVMGPLSEVGGVDSARRHPLMPRDDAGQPLAITSGEVDALLEIAGERPEALAALFAQVHPLVIANVRQASRASREITRKALALHIPPDDAEKIDRLADLFNGGFGSPMYAANRAELAAVGLPIIEPDPELWGNIANLVQLYQQALYNDRTDPTAHNTYFRYVCIIECAGRSTGLRQVFTHIEGQERVVQMGWETAVKGPGMGPSFGPGGLSNN